jgi:2,3-dihydroxyethylbenzene 1,2-dioxygenase
VSARWFGAQEKSQMVQVTELGYFGLGVRDLSAWKQFARDVLALQVVEEAGEPDRAYLRMDYWHHRFVLHADGDDDLAYLGFRVAGAEEFGEMQKQLANAGVAYRVGSLGEAEERRVLEVMKLADPDGHPIEIFHGPLVRANQPFHPGRGMHGRFVTGAGGAGHCIVRERDSDAAIRFYQALGMRGGVEYKFGSGPKALQLRFMHCSPRDHSVAWGVPGGEKRLNHIMLEVDNLDDVGLTHDIVRKAKIPVSIPLGKHSNDQMFSFYFQSPSGFAIEYGFGGRSATYQSEYFDADVYGHQGLL